MSNEKQTETAEDRPPAADNIVSLEGVLEKKWKRRECQHDHVEVDEQNRIVTCKDCNREVDAFTALLRLADRTSEWQSRWRGMRKDYDNLASWVPHLRAVRSLEGMWRGHRLPMCPHCKKGVSAESLNSMGWVHQRYAEAVQEHERQTLPEAEIVQIGGASTNAE